MFGGLKPGFLNDNRSTRSRSSSSGKSTSPNNRGTNSARAESSSSSTFDDTVVFEKTGIAESKPVVSAVLIAFRTLFNQNRNLAQKLFNKCHNPNYQLSASEISELSRLAFVDQNGNVNNSVKNIICGTSSTVSVIARELQLSDRRH